jgi:hypothetical protein
MIEIRHHYHGKRLYIAGFRIHHGATSALLALVGIAGMIHDFKDRRDWFRAERSEQ